MTDLCSTQCPIIVINVRHYISCVDCLLDTHTEQPLLVYKKIMPLKLEITTISARLRYHNPGSLGGGGGGIGVRMTPRPRLFWL